MSDTQTLTAAIAGGEHDADLGAIFDATFARASELEVGFRWRITHDGDEWTAETVTLVELAFAERLTGRSWAELDPVRHMDHLVALITAHLKEVRGYPVAAAVAAAGWLKASDLDGIVSVYEAPKGG